MNGRLRTGMPQSGLCGRIIRREAIEIAGFVIEKYKSFDTSLPMLITMLTPYMSCTNR